jgi:hypothetical protein
VVLNVSNLNIPIKETLSHEDKSKTQLPKRKQRGENVSKRKGKMYNENLNKQNLDIRKKLMSVKQGLFAGRNQQWRGSTKGEGEVERDGCTLYACMKIQ